MLVFLGSWIGPIEWPAHFPDLSLLDFFIWSLEYLRQKIVLSIVLPSKMKECQLKCNETQFQSVFLKSGTCMITPPKNPRRCCTFSLNNFYFTQTVTYHLYLESLEEGPTLDFLI